MPTDLYTSLDNLSERRIGIMVAMIPSQRWSTLVIWRIRIMGKYLHNIPQILVATRLSSSRGWSLVLLHIGRRYNASQNWRHIAKGRGDNGDVAASPHCQWPTIMAEHLCNWLHSRRQKEFKAMMIKPLVHSHNRSTSSSSSSSFSSAKGLYGPMPSLQVEHVRLVGWYAL